MTEAHRMTDHKRRKYFLVFSFISLCIVYIITDYVSSRDFNSYDGKSYISQYLVPPESKEVASVDVASVDVASVDVASVDVASVDVASVDVAGATDVSFDNSYKIVNTYETASAANIPSSNVTITITTIDDKKSFNISYPNLVTAKIKRNIFVETKDIKKSTENIFFIESRCATSKMAVHFRGNRGFVLNARQCCAIESTAQMNLDRNIYIFHSCTLDNDFFLYSPKFVKKLFKYPNVYVVRLNTTEVFSNSPLEELDRKKRLETSTYPVEHTSDLLRLTLLWRYGGTYCDLDVVTIRSLHNLKTNWAGMQDSSTIANGVINFEPKGVGHRMLQRALELVNRNYDPYNWSSNGPILITPIILQECRVKSVDEANQHCNGNFKVYNSSVLYPYYYSDSGQFFDSSRGKLIVEDVKSRSYSVHIWNKMSRDMVATVGSTQAYALLAEEFCPLVYKSCGTNF